MSATLHIEVSFDLICPWCWIGKRNLETALTLAKQHKPGLKAVIHWRGVQLLPHIPRAGQPFAEFYERRLGGKLAVGIRREQVRQAAANAGLDIRLESISTLPNTALAHHLLTMADGTTHDALLEDLFAAYFLDGFDIGSAHVLYGLASRRGLHVAPDILAISHEGSTTPEVRGAPGMFGLPYYVINGKHALAGAQPVGTLVPLLLDIAREAAVSPSPMPASAAANTCAT